MNNKLFIFIAIASAFYAASGCKTEGCTDPISIDYDSNADKDNGSCRYAGEGGGVTLVAIPQHHGKAIISGTFSYPDSVSHPDSAFVKFNVVESPGSSPSSYDLHIEGEFGEEHVHVPGLKPGKYFIYMTGYDSTISRFVRGGIPVVISQSSGEMDLNVPVSEY